MKMIYYSSPLRGAMTVGGEVEGCPGFRCAVCMYGLPFIVSSPMIGYLFLECQFCFPVGVEARGEGGRGFLVRLVAFLFGALGVACYRCTRLSRNAGQSKRK